MKLHHLGFVVSDIKAAAAAYPGVHEVRSVYDPLQSADLALFSCGGTFLEFIKPRNPEAFTWKFLQDGGGFHHLCFEVPTLAAANSMLQAERLMKIRGPIPAVLFDDRQVIFTMSRGRRIVEFLVDERDSTSL